MRSFVALPLPEPLIDPLLALQTRLPAGRPVPEDNLHLTLAFLGDVDDAGLAEIDLCLSGLVADAVPLRLSGLVSYGGDHGQALAIEAVADPALNALHTGVRRAVRAAGITLPSRRFRPHVTLARLRRGEAERPAMALALRNAAGAQLPKALADSFALYGSDLRPAGARHQILAAYPLRRAAPHDTSA